MNIELVILPSGLQVGKYPITQAQWREVMGTNPSYFVGDDRPVECVSFYDAREFCVRLSELTGIAYRLPSSSEWEYACRAGTITAFSFGDDELMLDDYAWYRKNASNQTHPVGEKLPNPWGLYDMHGNVWEWCKDGEDEYHWLRGGSWAIDGVGCCSAYRNSNTPDVCGVNIGFRVVVNGEDAS